MLRHLNPELQQRQLRFAQNFTESDLCRFVLRANRRFIRAITLGIFPQTSASSDHEDKDPEQIFLAGGKTGDHVEDGIDSKKRRKMAKTDVPELAAVRRFLEESTPQTRLLQGSLER